ncbi:MAG TPA: hypothetical protein VKF81_06665, partial [Blastocatellia bacterium]|nr:hypothetical protein [Blastocatellia bacterium]
LREIDRPRLQVAIEATVAEVTLTDELQFGVRYFFTSNDARYGTDKACSQRVPLCWRYYGRDCAVTESNSLQSYRLAHSYAPRFGWSSM